MKQLTEQQMIDHQKSVQDQIIADLNALSYKYDAKQLAVIMFWKACQLFRCVHSLGIWPVKEVEVFTSEAMKDILTPVPRDQLPKQAILTPDGVQPITVQGKLS